MAKKANKRRGVVNKRIKQKSSKPPSAMGQGKNDDDKENRSLFGSLNHLVFWPPFLLLLLAVILNFVDAQRFKQITEGANNWVLGNFGWLFSFCATLAVSLCIFICFSKFSKVRIGGSDAKPLMSMWNWFSITICTTVAVGILFWATAEPILHLTQPPWDLNVEPGSSGAASFAMSTMYVHWTFTPYAIYCVASLMFAFAYYNMKKPFSLGATVTPLFGNWILGKPGNVLDAICLYSLVAGMAASLGTGILTISGGLNYLWDVPRVSWVWALIALVIVGTFIVSSATGLMKGIRILSDLNAKALVGLAILTFFLGPTLFIISFGGLGIWNYLWCFIPMNVSPASVAGAAWSQSWTVFYWAVWMAWAPITACFLGRISYGRTVREFMLVNFIFPALFSMAWMAIFSGTAIHLQQTGAVDLAGAIKNRGNEFASYAVFETFPLAIVIIVFYVSSAFICFVTSADSNTTAMAAISSTGISPENPEGNLWIKVLWGVSVGTVAWVMISFADIEGIKMISNLGGFPAALLMLLIIASLMRVVLNHEKLTRVK